MSATGSSHLIYTLVKSSPSFSRLELYWCCSFRKFPEHTHIGGEEFLVLEGTFKDQFGAFAAGTYVRNPVDSSHAPWVDEDGCTIMVKLMQMADTGEGTDSLHVNLETAKASSGKSTEYGTATQLYSNDQTGEVVEMCWMNAEALLTVDEPLAGGEELFVVAGSLRLGDDTYGRWGWLRFPPLVKDTRRAGLKAGSDGAQVFRKTGHLTEKSLSMETIQFSEDETVSVRRSTADVDKA